MTNRLSLAQIFAEGNDSTFISNIISKDFYSNDPLMLPFAFFQTMENAQKTFPDVNIEKFFGEIVSRSGYYRGMVLPQLIQPGPKTVSLIKQLRKYGMDFDTAKILVIFHPLLYAYETIQEMMHGGIFQTLAEIAARLDNLDHMGQYDEFWERIMVPMNMFANQIGANQFLQGLAQIEQEYFSQAYHPPK